MQILLHEHRYNSVEFFIAFVCHQMPQQAAGLLGDLDAYWLWMC